MVLVEAPEVPEKKILTQGDIFDRSLLFSSFLSCVGGLLISSAHFGAYVCGTDIDYNTIHGLGMLHILKPLKSYLLESKNTDGSK